MTHSGTRNGDGPAGTTAPSASNVRRVHIDGLELAARIGVYPHEHGRLQPIHLWLRLDVRDGYDGRSDRLADVYDYDEALQIIRSITAARHFNLLERLAEEIAQACLADPRVQALRLRIAKPDAVPDCRAVAIEIERTRPGA